MRWVNYRVVDGDNLVERRKYKGGNVYINESQYFENVPETAWSFFIGGYQPLKSGLKTVGGKS